MRVALVIYDSLETISGGYLYDRMLVSKLRQRGDSVDVISLRRRPYLVNLLHNLSFRLPRGYDVVLQDELNHPSLLLANRRPHDVAIVTIVHHLRSSERRAAWQNALYRMIERQYLNSVDGFIINSNTTRSTVEAVVGAGNACVVAEPGGDRLGSATDAEIRRRAYDAGPLRLICVGNVTPAKGIDVLIDAMSLLPAGEFALEVVGPQQATPHYFNRLVRRARRNGLDVTFSGALDDAALASRLRRSHALVVPSYYEGFGIVYLEAMAFGLPAVATHAGAAPSLITDGQDGFLVDPGDSRTLSERLRALGADREVLLAMGLAASRRFHRAETWDASMEKVRDFMLGVAA